MMKKVVFIILIAAVIMTGQSLTAEASYLDVAPEATYSKAVAWCEEQGLMNGVGENRFDPEGTLTRAMMATILYRATGSPAVSGTPGFSDAQAYAWYADAVTWADSDGIMQGYGGHIFGINDPVSVEQLNVILDRYQGMGDTWVGNPALAAPATRAQIATALMERLRTESTLTPHPAQKGELGYLLYTPADPKPNMPMIVYLHGGSGKGNDLSLLTGGSFPKYLSDGDLGEIPAYVVMPQLEKDQKGWSNVSVQLSVLLDELCTAYQIDTSRVSLTGHSMGGTGSWAIAAAMPQRFSCVAPMSGSIQATTENVSALSGLPVWAVVGENDSIVSPLSSQQMVEALNKAGGNAKLTTMPNASHFDVPAAYLNQDLSVISWMLAQSK